MPELSQLTKTTINPLNS